MEPGLITMHSKRGPRASRHERRDFAAMLLGTYRTKNRAQEWLSKRAPAPKLTRHSRATPGTRADGIRAVCRCARVRRFRGARYVRSKIVLDECDAIGHTWHYGGAHRQQTQSPSTHVSTLLNIAIKQSWSRPWGSQPSGKYPYPVRVGLCGAGNSQSKNLRQITNRLDSGSGAESSSKCNNSFKLGLDLAFPIQVLTPLAGWSTTARPSLG
jgi:hypothetical protein